MLADTDGVVVAVRLFVCVGEVVDDTLPVMVWVTEGDTVVVSVEVCVVVLLILLLNVLL